MKESWIAAIFAIFALALGITFVLPFALRPGKTHALRQLCIANLIAIDGATKTWMIDHHKTTNDIPTDSDIFGTNRYIGKKPRCPSGGVYTLGPAGDRPNCSIPDHNIWKIHRPD